MSVRPTALIIGGAEKVYEDIAAAKELFNPDLYIAVNDMGMYIEDLDHWATMHPEKLYAWLRFRRVRKSYKDPMLWTAVHKKEHFNRTDLFPLNQVQSKGGGSGLLAAELAIHLGHKGVLCGIPMSAEAGHIVRKQVWKDCGRYVRGWIIATPKIKDHIRSMSGWTQQQYGAPTKEWLES